MATYGEPWPYYTQRIPYYGDPICPHCGKTPYFVTPYYTWTVTSGTSPLTFSKERVERFVVEQGASTDSAMRAEEV